MDNTAPTVTITGVPATSTAAFTATFTFSEAVTGFVVGDITLGNATASNFTATSTTVYTALITSTASGTVTVTVTVDVAAAVAQDAAGNGNTAATQASSTYTSTNNLAVGGPTITGTAQVGQTLTADTTGITDADGLTSPTYTYQWIRANGTEADITDADSSTYTLVDADADKTIKVRVTFNDDDGNAERLTSVATATVQAVTLRLMNGSGNHEGRLEMRYDGEWRPICDDYWTDVEAGVACRILGFTRGAVDNEGRTRSLPLHFGTAGNEFWLDNVNCEGDETNLIACPRRGGLAVGEHNCRAREAVGVRCLTGSEPRVESVAVSPASGPYAAGGTLRVTVRWTEAVVVTTPAGELGPKLVVRYTTGQTIRTHGAVYARGSGTAALVFEHTRAGGDSFESVTVLPNTLRVRDGAIVSKADETIAADLAHDDSHLALMTATQIEAPVVVAVPVVEGTPVVGEPVDGAWTAGETVEVQLTFSEPVAVGTTGGTPSIDLRLGTQTQTHHAQYTSGTGTNELVFGYTLAEDEGPHNTVLVPGDSLALNGGTIVSAADGTVDADLAHVGVAKMALPPLPVSERAVRDVADRPTARFSDVPATHDGATAFEVKLSFSAAPGLDEGTVRGAVEVSCATESCATVSGASRVTDSEWRVTVEPSQAYAITLTLPVRACGETGAVCIGGRTLAGPASATIPGRALTATLTHRPGEDDVRGEHKGSGTFEVRLAFNTEPEVSYKTVRDTMFDVTGGTITGARRVTRRNDQHFDIVVKPSGSDAMTFSLHSPLPACGETGSVCTEAGRMIEGPVSATVLGPVAISVADATVREEEGATLAFAVTLDREREADVTVDYATGNGTATAGEDYVAQSGDLTFAAGETAKTVEVEVLDDVHDEGTETMTLTLSNPSGARIADATATGTIENSDHMLQAWMVRFGRTVGSQVVDALGQRLGGGQASHVTVAGVPLTGGAAPVPEDKADDAFGLPEWAKDARREQEARTITADDLRLRSAFHLSSGSGEPGGPAFTTWGRVSTGGFDAEVDDVTTGGAVTMDGDVTTGLLGFDAEWDNLLAGVMLSQSTGEGAYRVDPAEGHDAGTDGGTLESDLTGVYPYARINLDARVSAWALAGAGSGSITLTRGRARCDEDGPLDAHGGAGGAGAGARRDRALRHEARLEERCDVGGHEERTLGRHEGDAKAMSRGCGSSRRASATSSSPNRARSRQALSWGCATTAETPRPGWGSSLERGFATWSGASPSRPGRGRWSRTRHRATRSGARARPSG